MEEESFKTPLRGRRIEITDEEGRVVERLRYKPFGQLKGSKSKKDLNAFTFTGREYDQDSGLYYYRSRYYNSANGRFLSRDPITTASLRLPTCLLYGRSTSSNGNMQNLFPSHPYIYCYNNPVNYNDPKGEYVFVIGVGWKIVAGIIAGVLIVTEILRYRKNWKRYPEPAGPAQEPYRVPPPQPWYPPGR